MSSDFFRPPSFPSNPEILSTENKKKLPGCDGCRWGLDLDRLEDGTFIHRYPNGYFFHFCYLKDKSLGITK